MWDIMLREVYGWRWVDWVMSAITGVRWSYIKVLGSHHSHLPFHRQPGICILCETVCLQFVRLKSCWQTQWSHMNSYSVLFPVCFQKHGSDWSRVGGVWGYVCVGSKWNIILSDLGMVGHGWNPSSLEFEADRLEVETFVGYQETARKPWGTELDLW
jgi:hypothetical protein